jgi:hypothetical protein
MPERPILLKLLLRERHWQNYGTFCARAWFTSMWDHLSYEFPA